MGLIKCQFSVMSWMYIPILLIIFKTTSIIQVYSVTYDCDTDTFTNNSQYQANLDTLFDYLSSNATNSSGYYQAVSTSNGSSEEMDVVIYGHFLCRGDLNTTECHDCITTATTELPTIYCPNKKEALVWYDLCMVRYSNQSFFGSYDRMGASLYWSTDTVTRNGTQFKELIISMMSDVLFVRAATGGSEKKFATDFTNFTSLKTIYGLAQCTPDLSPSDCNKCLDSGFGYTGKSQVAERFTESGCEGRYSMDPFFNLASLSPSQPQPPSPTPDISHPSDNEKVNAKVIIIISISVVAVSTLLLALGIFLIKRRARNKNNRPIVGSDSNLIAEQFLTPEALQYDLTTIQSATNNFCIENNKLGEGGFGCVYKGTLEDGQEIAVKRLSQLSVQGEQEFKNEVLLLAKLQHKNLVKLLGFCLDKNEKLLVYEYAPNKSLDQFLMDPEKKRQLDWATRYEIIGGIAHGMLYLHVYSQPKIIHRDLKAANVLLDANMNPIVADFGTARMFSADQTHVNTIRIVGTQGYMAPEYLRLGEFSTRSDVYSYGVLILEIISGIKNSCFKQTDHSKDLLSYAWKQWKDDKAMDFVDPTIRDCCSTHQVLRCMHVGLLCVQEDMNNRPPMKRVVHMLEIDSVSLQAPEQPGFFRSSSSRSLYISAESI